MPQLSSMRLDDRAADCEPETRAVRLGGEERAEDACKLALVDALAMVDFAAVAQDCIRRLWALRISPQREHRQHEESDADESNDERRLAHVIEFSRQILAGAVCSALDAPVYRRT